MVVMRTAKWDSARASAKRPGIGISEMLCSPLCRGSTARAEEMNT
jgi:hypothetical protein